MRWRYLLEMLLLFIFLLAGCSSEPCDDLKNKAEDCIDNDVRALLLSIVDKGDKQECTDYLNSYHYTFESRCIYKDAESVLDADIDTD